MERRLLHRWYGNVPEGGEPALTRSIASTEFNRGTHPGFAMEDVQLVIDWKRTVAHLIEEEHKEIKKLDLLEMERGALPARQRDRTPDDDMRLFEIEAEWNGIQEDIRRLQETQKHFYTLLRLFGA